jgi:hypothetical protein
MKIVKHTKEELARRQTGLHHLHRPRRRAAGDRNLVTDDHNGIRHLIGEETWANAHLMRSAAQSLAALKAMLGKAHKQKGNDQYPKPIEQAESAIVLAEAGFPTTSDGDDELGFL